MYGIIDEDYFSLQSPRTCDYGADSLAEAFKVAQELLANGCDKVSICTARVEEDGTIVEVDTQYVIHNYTEEVSDE